jgi:hypothetical protein
MGGTVRVPPSARRATSATASMQRRGAVGGVSAVGTGAGTCHRSRRRATHGAARPWRRAAACWAGGGQSWVRRGQGGQDREQGETGDQSQPDDPGGTAAGGTRRSGGPGSDRATGWTARHGASAAGSVANTIRYSSRGRGGRGAVRHRPARWVLTSASRAGGSAARGRQPRGGNRRRTADGETAARVIRTGPCTKNRAQRRGRARLGVWEMNHDDAL